MSAPERCMDVLGRLVEAAPVGLPLTRLADALGAPKSAVHRLLQALTEQGFVRQDPATQHYVATLRLATLGFRLLEAQGAADACQPALVALATEADAFARLAVVEGERIAYVARAQGARTSLRYEPVMGRPVRLHATATGKVWLASLPEETALRLWAAQAQGQESLPVGPRAITTRAALRSELRATHARGWGIAIEEGEAGVSAMAAPIRPAASGGAVAGVVSLAAPSLWLTEARMQTLLPHLLRTAAEMAELWPLRARIAHPQPLETA